MKKVILSLILLFFANLFTSCKKCKDCDYYIMGIKQEGQTSEFCDDELDAAKNNYDNSSATGWDCK